MSELTKRLKGIESSPELLRGIEDLGKKIELLGKKPHETNNSEKISAEIRKLDSKIDSAGKRDDLGSRMKAELSKLYGKIESLEKNQKLPSFVQAEIRALSKNLPGIAEKKQKRQMKEILSKLEKKLSKIEKKSAAKAEINKIVAKIKSRPVSKIPKAKLNQLEKKLGSIEKRIISEQKEMAKAANSRQRKHQAEVEHLEKKMALLKQGYELGAISKEAYFKDKAKIDAFLRK